MHSKIIATLLASTLTFASIQTMTAATKTTNKPIITSSPIPSVTPAPTVAVSPSPISTPSPTATTSTKASVPKIPYTEADVIKIAKTLYGECRHPRVPMHEKAAVVWCILNRVDSPNWSNTIDKVITKSQFHGYSASNPVWPELEIITRDVLSRWYLEKLGISNSGRTLPSNYYFFADDKKGGNRFRTTYRNGKYWDWSLPSPYSD